MIVSVKLEKHIPLANKPLRTDGSNNDSKFKNLIYWDSQGNEEKGISKVIL